MHLFILLPIGIIGAGHHLCRTYYSVKCMCCSSMLHADSCLLFFVGLAVFADFSVKQKKCPCFAGGLVLLCLLILSAPC